MSAFLHKQMAIMSCKKINKVLPGNVRQQLEQKLGHTFAKPDLLWEALQADGNGIGQIGDRKVENGNKKMAMLGDSVLQLAVLRDWFSSHESRKAGNGLSSSVGSNRNLDRCGRENGLDKFITPHPSFVEGTIPPRTMSATVEALIGAVFLDSGENLEAVKRAMKGLGLLALPETADTPKQNPLS